MNRTPAIFAIRALGVLALIALTPIAAQRSDDADALYLSRQSSADRSVSAPIIVAQGRCYNGRCY